MSNNKSNLSPSIDSIIAEDLSVRYRVPKERRRSIKQLLLHPGQANLSYDDFWALRNVSFSVRQGETLGIIGQNGAGKTTLLSVIARVLKPTKGFVQVRGRLSPLLGLGAGFDPELSGRENTYLNGSILGLTKKMVDERFQRIVEFAELQAFIDAPLKTYSSGMSARLGFAIATEVNPDILLLDEVLSVGDERFQKKCEERIAGFHARGVTIIFVSHNLKGVQDICSRVIWLEKGQIAGDGKPGAVVAAFRRLLERI